MSSKIGLVLSGGGVKALAHVGLIKVLLENNIMPNEVAGTSGGAIVSALYASGYSPAEMVTFFKDMPLMKWSLYALNKPGIIDSDKYELFFKNYFPENFEDLNIPLTVTATNLLTGRLNYFSSGELIKPLIASSALPPVFSPIEINGNLYSDGGILNNFPIEPLRKSCNKLIGSFVNPIEPIKKSDINSSLKVLYRVYHIGLDANDIKKFKKCEYVFAPSEIRKIGVLDTKSIDKAFSIGYEYASNQIEKIKNVIT